MPGWENRIAFNNAMAIAPTEAQEAFLSQRITDAISFYNSDGSPEGVLEANPGSFCGDETNGDWYRKASGSGNTGWVLMESVPSNIVANAYLSTGLSNVTGDGTAVNPLIFDSIISNEGSGYNDTTGVFTAPESRNYMINATVMFNSLLASHSQGELRITFSSGLPFVTYFNPGLNASNVTGYTDVYSHSVQCVRTLNVSQTVDIRAVVRGATQTVGIQGAATNNSGFETYVNIIALSDSTISP